MATFLLTWNPHKAPWPDLPADAARCRSTGHLDDRWSCGRSKRIQPGDRVFLLRQGKEPRGLIGAGSATSQMFEALHWNPNATTRIPIARYIDVRFDVLLDAEHEPIFRREWLDGEPFAGVHWNTQISGISIPEPVARVLEREWASFLVSRRIKS